MLCNPFALLLALAATLAASGRPVVSFAVFHHSDKCDDAWGDAVPLDEARHVPVCDSGGCHCDRLCRARVLCGLGASCDLSGIALWADHGTHTFVPALTCLWWVFFATKPAFRVSDMVVWVTWPLI